MKTLEELADEYVIHFDEPKYGKETFLAGYAAANRWISVEEELPKENGTYLVLAHEVGFQFVLEPAIAEYTNGRWLVDTSFISGRDYDVDPIQLGYWMPLPPLPNK